VIPVGSEPAVIPALNSVITPLVVMRPMRLPACSVNQRLPSGPTVMLSGRAGSVRPAVKNVATPAGVTRMMASGES
jgi:hypothetical protein